MQVQVPLPPIELDLLLPKHHIEAKGVLGASSVSYHLVEVLLPSSLSLGLLGIKVGIDLGEGFL
jgi:hypothetical protein